MGIDLSSSKTLEMILQVDTQKTYSEFCGGLNLARDCVVICLAKVSAAFKIFYWNHTHK